jgi:hypothetical protein
VHSGLPTVAGTTYLLQRQETVQVGGAGHIGAAGFHDRQPDGRGQSEGQNGGDFVVELGVGVEERTTGDHPLRGRWGSFRLDHSDGILYTQRGRKRVRRDGESGGVHQNEAGFLPVNIWAIS